MKSLDPISGPVSGPRQRAAHWVTPAVRKTAKLTEHRPTRRFFDARPEPTDGSWDEGGRRVLNVITALLLIALSAPLMLVIALAIRLTSRGPAIFVQRRVGLDRRDQPLPFVGDRRGSDRGGRIFRIFKFRTMCHDDNRDCDEVWASEDDPRITLVGRFLRAYRLDELPQLFNVLLGDMNIVGPRPEQPQIFTELRQEVEGYRVRQSVLPGITGLAQVSRGYDRSTEDVREKLEYDLEYLERRSLWEDIKIMAKTAPVMLFKRGSR